MEKLYEQRKTISKFFWETIFTLVCIQCIQLCFPKYVSRNISPIKDPMRIKGRLMRSMINLLCEIQQLRFVYLFIWKLMGLFSTEQGAQAWGVQDLLTRFVPKCSTVIPLACGAKDVPCTGRRYTNGFVK